MRLIWDPRPEVLEVEGLSVQYGRNEAVKQLDLNVAKNEVVGLIGPNGAGKSSTVRAIAGLQQADARKIEFCGQSILKRTPESIVRLGVSLVPEGRHIFPALTVKENLVVGASSRPSSELHERIDHYVQRFPVLGRYLDQPAGRLSGGEQQQLAIARALLADPSLLLLDEPTLGLSPVMVDQVFEILEGLRRDGTTILLIEQSASRTLAFADRSLLLSNGQVQHTFERGDNPNIDEVSGVYLTGGK